MVSSPDERSAENPTLEYILAALTLGSFAYVWWLVNTFDLDADFLQLQQQLELHLSPRIALAGTLSVIAALVFWIRMFRDYFRHQPARHVAFWGVFLFIGGHLAALVYFVAIWRPRRRAG